MDSPLGTERAQESLNRRGSIVRFGPTRPGDGRSPVIAGQSRPVEGGALARFHHARISAASGCALVCILLVGCPDPAPTTLKTSECERLRQENARIARTLQDTEQKLQIQTGYVAGMTKKFGELEDQVAKLEAERNPPSIEEEPPGEPLLFSSLPFEETGADNHEHHAIALAGVPIIVLRTKAGFSTIAGRAAAVVSALNRAAASGLLLTESHHRLVAKTPNGSNNEILKIDRGDIIGLRRRSAGEVTSERVSAYWAAIINDYFDLASGREPKRLGLSGIEGVRILHRELARASQPPGKPVSSNSLKAAIDRLRTEERQALIDLSMYVPTRFRSLEESLRSGDDE